MPKYKSVNVEPRYYPTLSVMVSPDEIVELPEGTDAAGLVLVADKKIKDTVTEVEGVANNG